jgi:peptide/nickel transport system ATP-binding protein
MAPGSSGSEGVSGRPSTAGEGLRATVGQRGFTLIELLVVIIVAAVITGMVTLSGSPSPDRVLRQYPHELSGGMRQRVLIASAFAAEPKLIVADEPTTALDVTVQKEVLRLIAGMQARHGTSLLFVTHDLGVVSKVCQSLSVLYAGMVVEDTTVRDFFRAPAHRYARALLAATPKYTDPDSSLVPVAQDVLDGVQAQVDAADRGWRNG